MNEKLTMSGIVLCLLLLSLPSLSKTVNAEEIDSIKISDCQTLISSKPGVVPEGNLWFPGICLYWIIISIISYLCSIIAPGDIKR